MALARYLVIHAIKNNKLAAGSALNPLDIVTGLELIAGTQVSNLIIDCPQVVTLDLHPLLASGTEFWRPGCYHDSGTGGR